MTAVVPPAHITAPLALAARKCGYRIFKAPASGPAKIRSSAMKRPKNTAQTPHRAKSCLASATCPGPKCLGKRLPRRSNSDIPKRRPIEYPIVSPTMAPMVAAVATPTGLMSRVWRDDSRAALTSAISPGNGMPRLSTPMTVPTMRYTASGGIVCRKPSMSTALTIPLVGVRRAVMGGRGTPPASADSLALVDQHGAVGLITQRLQRDVGTFCGEPNDLRQLSRRVTLQVMVGGGQQPIAVSSRLVFEVRLPYVVGDPKRRDVVMCAPHQGKVDIALGKCFEPTGFVLGALVQIRNGVRQHPNAVVVCKAPRQSCDLRVLQ